MYNESQDLREQNTAFRAENARLQERVEEAEGEIGETWVRGLDIWDYVHLQLLPERDEARALAERRKAALERARGDLNEWTGDCEHPGEEDEDCWIHSGIVALDVAIEEEAP